MHNTNKAPLNMHGADNLGSFQKDGGIYIPLKTANSYFMENPTFDVHVPSEMHKSNVIPIEDSYSLNHNHDYKESLGRILEREVLYYTVVLAIVVLGSPILGSIND